MKIRILAAVGVCLLGATTLTGCSTKVGSAAVVDGHKISESSLNSYLGPDAKPIQVSQTETTSARAFVLQFLVASQVFGDLVQQQHASDADRQAARQSVLGTNTDDQLISQLASVGIKSKFEPLYAQTLGDYAILNKAANNDSAKIAAQAAKIRVSVNPRYGSWNATSLQLADLATSQLPSFLKIDSSLPGDAPPSQ